MEMTCLFNAGICKCLRILNVQRLAETNSGAKTMSKKPCIGIKPTKDKSQIPQILGKAYAFSVCATSCSLRPYLVSSALQSARRGNS